MSATDGLKHAVAKHKLNTRTAFSPCVEIDALWQLLDMGKADPDDQRAAARWLVDLHAEHAAQGIETATAAKTAQTGLVHESPVQPGMRPKEGS